MSNFNSEFSNNEYIYTMDPPIKGVDMLEKLLISLLVAMLVFEHIRYQTLNHNTIL